MEDKWFNMEKVGYPYMEIDLEGVICCYRDTNTVEYLEGNQVILTGGRGTKTMRLEDICVKCIPKKYHRTFFKNVTLEEEEEVIPIALPKLFDFDDIRFFQKVEKELCRDWILQNYADKLSVNSIKAFMKGWIQHPSKPVNLGTHQSTLTPNQVWDILIRYNSGKVNIWQLAKEYDIQPAAVSKMVNGHTWKVAYHLMEAFKRENGVR